MRIIARTGAIAAIRDLPVEPAVLDYWKTIGDLGRSVCLILDRFLKNRHTRLETCARAPE